MTNGNKKGGHHTLLLLFPPEQRKHLRIRIPHSLPVLPDVYLVHRSARITVCQSFGHDCLVNIYLLTRCNRCPCVAGRIESEILVQLVPLDPLSETDIHRHYKVIHTCIMSIIAE